MVVIALWGLYSAPSHFALPLVARLPSQVAPCRRKVLRRVHDKYPHQVHLLSSSLVLAEGSYPGSTLLDRDSAQYHYGYAVFDDALSSFLSDEAHSNRFDFAPKC